MFEMKADIYFWYEQVYILTLEVASVNACIENVHGCSHQAIIILAGGRVWY